MSHGMGDQGAQNLRDANELYRLLEVLFSYLGFGAH
jgi:hypothetical protein